MCDPIHPFNTEEDDSMPHLGGDPTLLFPHHLGLILCECATA